MLVPDERKLYTKRFPRPDEVREARIIETMENIVQVLGPEGCSSVCIDQVFKEDIVRRLNYAGWKVTEAGKSGSSSYYSITPREIK
jgi:hypothetical protein